MVTAATLDLHEAAGCLWDVIVVGAGPAGSLAARQLALRAVRVLLVDRATFPRWKVCGSCLNGRTLATLTSVGLGPFTQKLGTNPLRTILLAAHGRRAGVALSGGVAVSRAAFDAWLLQAALDAGVAFLPGTCARLGTSHGDTRSVVLHRDHRQAHALGRVVLAANGLAPGLLVSAAGIRSVVQAGANIGAGVIVDQAPAFYRPGAIFMACGQGGYAGLVRLEDGRLNVAAAVAPLLVKEAGGLGKATAGLLRQSGLPAVPDLTGAAWRGTPRLTHSVACPAAERLFLLGDAAGYVEPFTGEGIGWALESAVTVTPLAHQACQRWDDSLVTQWQRLHRERVRQRWWACRAATKVLRTPTLTRVAIALLAAAPGIGSPFVRYLNAKDAS
jgi:flavin-dependent dehydrogenase